MRTLALNYKGTSMEAYVDDADFERVAGLHCYPATSAFIEPGFCDNCEHPIDLGAALEQADEQEADALAARADELVDRRRDEGR